MNVDENISIEVFKDAPDIYRPSPFWEELAATGISQLRDGGFENFKRTVNMKYFNWNTLGIIRHQLLPVLRFWLVNRDWSIFRSAFPKAKDSRFSNIKSFDPFSALIYRVYVAMLWHYIATQDTLGLLAKLDEPLVGNPFHIFYKGQRTSQDMYNSIHEFYRSGGAIATDGRSFDVAELGAGYGRVWQSWRCFS
jgi:hypothetical protein